MRTKSLSRTKGECKYHIVWIPKYRKRKLFKELGRHLGEVFKELARQKECQIVEGRLLVDHVHILIEIPPKHAVSQVIHKGKKCDTYRESIWREEEKFYRAKVLGKRILCVNSGQR